MYFSRQTCDYVMGIDVKHRNERIKPDITCIRYLHGTNKLALVDSTNARIKIISKINSPLYAKEETDLRIDFIGE